MIFLGWVSDFNCLKCSDTVSWRTKKHPDCKITCFNYHQRLSFWRTCYSVQCRLTPEKGWLLSLDWVKVLHPTRHKIHPPDNHHSSDDVYWRGEESWSNASCLFTQEQQEWKYDKNNSMIYTYCTATNYRLRTQLETASIHNRVIGRSWPIGSARMRRFNCWKFWRLSVIITWWLHKHNTLWMSHNHHSRFTALFPGPPRWDGARRELLDFMV